MLDILLVDDEAGIRVPLSHALRARGHRVATAADGAEAMSRLDTQVFSLVVSDVRLPRVDGFTILRRLRSESPGTDVVLMTAFGTIADAVAAMKERAIDYVTKPFDLQEMVLVVDRVEERRRLTRQLEDARAELAGRRASDLLVGRSPEMAHLRDQVLAVADSTAAVMITGESGTGKELVARLIHERSSRRDKPFIAVSCAAIPPSLIEAELFGHERGAFTGAVRRRVGRFKAADGGTLFLDEIGEMPIELQAKLLRVLQEGECEPIGSNTPVQVDVRLISATNRDLKAGVTAASFRHDLYYRIRVFELQLPPLRNRPGDLPLLANQFLAEFTPAGEKAPGLTPGAWAALERHPFPGNVRELKHAIHHATVLARGDEIDVHHLPRDIRGETQAAETEKVRPLARAIEQYEKAYIERTLLLFDQERKGAAGMLGISRKSLWKKMKRYGLL
jgi:DNA-binding NtrC family response regulator